MMNIEMLPLASLHINPDNPRRNDPAVDAVARSIAAFGFNNPIITDADLNIAAGHTRAKAALALGLKTVPVLRVAALTGAKFKGYAIADNQTATIATWDNEKLHALVAELNLEDNFDLATLGFSDNSLADILRDAEADAGIDDVPEPPAVPVTQPGDLWLLGNHRLLCGDSTDSQNHARVLNGETPDALIYDPPFDISPLPAIPGEWKSTLVFTDGKNAGASIEKFGAPTWVFVWNCIQNWFTFNRPLKAMKLCLWYGDIDKYKFDGAFYGDMPEGHGPTETHWGTYEYKPDPRGRHLADVFSLSIAALHGGAEHHHGKPLDWIRCLVGNCTDGAVFDPFAGSGTALIACEQLERACYAIELDAGYCDVIISRWENYSKRKGERISLCA